MSRPDQITRMFRNVQGQFGTLDIFVSNARPEVPAFFQPPLDITLEQWDTAFNSQAKAFLVGVREALPLMGDGGRIFAITYAEGSRTGGLQPWVGMGSAKAALESLVRYFAVALAKRGVTVNAISPGWTERLEYAAAAGTRSHQELARPRLDTNGTLGNAGRRRKCCGALLFGTSCLDNWAGDLRGWRRLIDESRGPARNSARVAGPERANQGHRECAA